MSVGEVHRASVEAVATLLTSAPLNGRLLTLSERAGYRSRSVVAGWRLKIWFPGGHRRVDVLVTDSFPFVPALTALVDRPEFLTWPHVERDGVLCVFPPSTAVDSAHPVAATAVALRDSCELIEQLITGKCIDDFRTEFLTYWNWVIDGQRVRLLSLIIPSGPSRLVKYWKGRQFWLLGDDEARLRDWLKHWDRRFDADGAQFDEGTLLWLSELLVPDQYPTNGADVLRLAQANGCEDLLRANVYTESSSLVILGGSSSAGTCLAGVHIVEGGVSIGKSRRRRTTEDGFRPGHVPKELLLQRKFGANRVVKSSVERIDRAWIHGRDHDPAQELLGQSAVTVIGCGSLGSHVASRLAEAGIGRLNLIDPQVLEWSNIGRHALSAHQVGTSKAESLAKLLSGQYPHADRIAGFNRTGQAVIVEEPQWFTESDLIISATGEWSLDSQLNTWHSRAASAPAIVYCWLEPLAAAGHAVAIFPGSGCLQCGFDGTGTPNLCVAEWPNETLLSEPGCGTYFQPYGPIELAHIVAAVASTALDYTLGHQCESSHRVWCGNKEILDARGGRWTHSWQSLACHRAEGGYLANLEWPADSDCPVCRTKE